MISALKFLSAAFLIFQLGCASAKKTEPELADYKGRRIALVDIDGEATDRKVIEVALVNQLVKRGSFELINKKEIEAARVDVKVDTSQANQIAKKAGAEVALRAKVLEFDGDVHEGYSKERVYDEQMAAERGEKEGETDRLYKVKRLDGKVRVELSFTDLTTNEIRTGIAEANESVEEDSRKGAIRLPPVLRFLERVSNSAFKNFFDKYE